MPQIHMDCFDYVRDRRWFNGTSYREGWKLSSFFVSFASFCSKMKGLFRQYKQALNRRKSERQRKMKDSRIGRIGRKLVDGSIHEFTKMLWVFLLPHLLLDLLNQKQSKRCSRFWLCNEALDDRQAGHMELVSLAEFLGDLE